MDTLTKEQRHFVMSQIKSRDTKPELLVRSYLHKLGFRFRKNDKRLTGKPDLYFPRYYAVIFVNGCFWHGHRSCRKVRIPKSNTEYWTQKIERNKERDKEEVKSLLEQGYRVGVVWECSITGKNRAQKIQALSESVALWLEEGFDQNYKEF
ncbi:MAG: very short patch repair endonuclease [Treponema sp.]|nr:very short patch repair endonuclease [Treponema sp.]MEE3435561.1 very short patch repair endonuclease [Treponema sp.]